MLSYPRIQAMGLEKEHGDDAQGPHSLSPRMLCTSPATCNPAGTSPAPQAPGFCLPTLLHVGFLSPTSASSAAFARGKATI